MLVLIKRRRSLTNKLHEASVLIEDVALVVIRSLEKELRKLAPKGSRLIKVMFSHDPIPNNTPSLSQSRHFTAEIDIHSDAMAYISTIRGGAMLSLQHGQWKLTFLSFDTPSAVIYIRSSPTKILERTIPKYSIRSNGKNPVRTTAQEVSRLMFGM